MNYPLAPITRVLADLHTAGAAAVAAVVAAIKAWKKGIYREQCVGIDGPSPTDTQVSALTAGLISWADLHAAALGIGTVLQHFREAWDRRHGPVCSGLTCGAWEKDSWIPLAMAADAALNRLESWLEQRSPDAPLEWSGPAWDALQPLPRRLLTYMRAREQADVADLENKVWGKDVEDAALHGALSKANEFLAKIASPRTLGKVRGEAVVRWH